MKWILIALGVVVALLVILFVVGAARPKSHLASVAFRIAKPDSAVWELVSNIEQTPQWAPDVRSVERLPDNAGRPAYRESFGGFEAMTVIAESKPPIRQVKEILPGGGFYGSWTWELAPDSGGTRLTITERGTVDNPLFRAFMMFADNRSTIRKYGAALGRRLGTAAVELSP